MPRIFIAIRFDDHMKDRLASIQDSLRKRGIQGKYCPYENLHMTLVFIGERYDLPSIRKAVSEVDFEPFDLTLSTLGSFPTKAGVIWCGVEQHQTIQKLVSTLRERLQAYGVAYKNGLFFPHISLIQQPTEIITDIEIPKASMPVLQICIMKSERIDGKLVYTEI
ncbi:MAG: RNA 2',3'-cyclic phosphodiesterase [Bacteroidales bacterium]|nr:RNA 2',3'-cyclic phosphodiesterase [Bacteroidales bacterium]